MPVTAKQIVQIAQTDMSQEAFRYWGALSLPAPNEEIEGLLAVLAARSQRSKTRHWRGLLVRLFWWR